MESHKTTSPILFLIFNRPNSTNLVFNEIRSAKPRQIFIASDGPRQHKSGEKEVVEALREEILSKIDWDCEVMTLFHTENLGCGVAVHKAIDWFFNCVEQGIILEDDCLPAPDFFEFCDEMLNRYADNPQIFEISGTNLQGGKVRGKGSYYFSRYGGIWGWATWARAWKNYDYQMSGLNKFIEQNALSTIFPSKKQQVFWNRVLPESKSIDTWDYQWLYTIWRNNGICIVPNSNLITNIGFNSEGTHTLAAPKWYEKLGGYREPLGNIVHPEKIEVSLDADKFQFENSIAAGKWADLKNFIKKILLVKKPKQG